MRVQAILREFKAASEGDLSSAKLKVLQQKARNDLLAVQVRTAKQHNAAMKAHLKEEAEIASGNPEEVAVKRRIQGLKKALAAAKKIVSGGDEEEVSWYCPSGHQGTVRAVCTVSIVQICCPIFNAQIRRDFDLFAYFILRRTLMVMVPPTRQNSHN